MYVVVLHQQSLILDLITLVFFGAQMNEHTQDESNMFQITYLEDASMLVFDWIDIPVFDMGGHQRTRYDVTSIVKNGDDYIMYLIHPYFPDESRAFFVDGDGVYFMLDDGDYFWTFTNPVDASLNNVKSFYSE